MFGLPVGASGMFVFAEGVSMFGLPVGASKALGLPIGASGMFDLNKPSPNCRSEKLVRRVPPSPTSVFNFPPGISMPGLPSLIFKFDPELKLRDFQALL